MGEKAADKKAETPSKGGLGKVIILIVALGVVAAFVVGAIFSPVIASKLHLGGKGSASAESHEKEEPEPAGVAVLDAIVVDLRDTNGDVHHLKVGVALELVKEMHGEEFKKLEPRGRDAAITYLRTLTFDDVTTPAKFDTIRKTLQERIIKAIGKAHVRRVLFTDFVAQ